jgi:hypothetical protein
MNCKSTGGQWALSLALLVGAGCGESPSPRHAGDKDKASPRAADAQLTSIDFAMEYQKDVERANRKYRQGWVELTGRIVGIGRNSAKRPQITLNGPADDLLGVVCFTVENEPWKKYTPGQIVKVRGRVPLDAKAASLTEGTVTEVERSAVPNLSASELARDYEADHGAVIKKFDKQYLIVTGTILNSETNDAGAVSMELKGEGKTNIRCLFRASEKDLAEPFKVGQEVRVLGEFTLNLAPGEVKLYSCLPITGP